MTPQRHRVPTAVIHDAQTARPYAPAVAGTVREQRYNATTRTFRLVYDSSGRPDVSELSTPPTAAGWQVSVQGPALARPRVARDIRRTGAAPRQSHGRYRYLSLTTSPSPSPVDRCVAKANAELGPQFLESQSYRHTL
ncbi:hypothetical protein [Streptomyces sp. NPDC048637]|uniref:hypothetical protein n=1 Tax=Streptomyces sp. NPDC048637 TaxID=3155636 RepID=UPI003414BC77